MVACHLRGGIQTPPLTPATIVTPTAVTTSLISWHCDQSSRPPVAVAEAGRVGDEAVAGGDLIVVPVGKPVSAAPQVARPDVGGRIRRY